jgi:hypothetical protein
LSEENNIIPGSLLWIPAHISLFTYYCEEDMVLVEKMHTFLEPQLGLYVGPAKNLNPVVKLAELNSGFNKGSTHWMDLRVWSVINIPGFSSSNLLINNKYLIKKE